MIFKTNFMKKCPNCNQVFSDDNFFCLNDGTTLLTVSNTSENIPVFPTPESAPTQFIPRSQINLTNPTNRIPGWLYAALGAMAAIILMLGGAFFIARSPAENNEKAEQNAKSNENILISNHSVVESKTAETPQENKLQDSKSETTVPQIEVSSKQIETPPITTEAVHNLLTRWEKAQDGQNFGVYQACYGQPFKGIKRVGSETKVYNYTSWLNDRRRMLENAIGLDVEVENLQVTIEGDTATAEFDQYYRSLRHSDWGPKILKIKMFPDGARIVYEELKASYPLN